MIIEILLSLILAMFVTSFMAGIIIGRKIYKLIYNFLPSGVVSPSSTEEPSRDNDIKSNWKYKLTLWKRWFDTGYGVTSYLKWFIAVIGVVGVVKGMPVNIIIIIGLSYGVFCFVFGYFWYRWGFAIATQEVDNQYDLFVKEIRKRKNI